MGLFAKFKSLFGGTDDSGKYTGIISDKERQIVALEKEISELKESTTTGGTVIKEKDGQIYTLEEEIANLRRSITKGDATIKAKEDRISVLERTVANLKEKREAPEPEPKPEPKTESKPEPQKLESPITETPAARLPEAETLELDNLKAQPKAKTGDPYQQLGQELVDALKKTTRGGDDEPGEAK